MFSVNRFDPNQHSSQSNQTKEFNPLARLNQRLSLANKQEEPQEAPQETPNPTTIEHQSKSHVKPLDQRFSASTTQKEEYHGQKHVPLSRRQKARLELGFTGPNTIPLLSRNDPAASKPKSSAKLKYLKRKKERVKSRKQSLRKSNVAIKTDEKNSKDAEEDQSQLTSAVAINQYQQHASPPKIIPQPLTADTPHHTEPATAPETLKKRVKRPKNLDRALEKISKKKVKTEHQPSNQNTKPAETKNPEEENPKEENKLYEEEENKSENENEKEEEVNTETMIINQPGVLPRFPAPTNSNIPDPQLLARLAMGLGLRQSSSSTHDLQDFMHFNSQSILPINQIQLRPSNPDPLSQTVEKCAPDNPAPFRLSRHSVDKLSQLGFPSILAVQIAVFSILIPSLSDNANTPASNFYPTRNSPRDLCVNAPTGSGKTLSYIVPIIETLKSRLVCRIRALIVLPTRDLVLQVKNTFDTFASGTGLKAAILTGHHSFSREQALLGGTNDGLEGLVDVVIATPGRLLDHLAYTPGLSTEHLCFLVLDEADQLLNKRSQNWLHQILNPNKSNPHKPTLRHDHKLSNSSKSFNKPFLELFDDERQQADETLNLDNRLFSTLIDGDDHPHHFPNPIQPSSSWGRTKTQSSWTLPVETHNPCRLRPFRILLFSATLKRDPTKVEHLGLRHPIFIKVSSNMTLEDEGSESGVGTQKNKEIRTKNLDASLDHLNEFSLPSTLKQHIIVTRTDLKPLVFMKLVISKDIKRALCFCKSVEGAERLASLCKFIFNDPSNSANHLPYQPNTGVENHDGPEHQVGVHELFKVECFSSDLSPADRAKILKSFQLGQINMLICSDMIARGIDLPEVRNVINYDAPIEMKKYVHRVGRTARANELGHAYTLIESQEAKFVKNFLKLGLGPLGWENQISKLRFNWFDLQDLNPAYQIGLKKLAEKYGRTIDL